MFFGFLLARITAITPAPKTSALAVRGHKKKSQGKSWLGFLWEVL
jgi:hypothetical protein